MYVRSMGAFLASWGTRLRMARRILACRNYALVFRTIAELGYPGVIAHLAESSGSGDMLCSRDRIRWERLYESTLTWRAIA
jgi:hypothetical protein